MWIFLKNSALALTAHPEDERLILAQARLQGDIEDLFPEADVIENPLAEYRFQATIGRDRAADAIALAARHIDYPDLVTSVADPVRFSMYGAVEAATASAQAQGGGHLPDLQDTQEIGYERGP